MYKNEKCEILDGEYIDDNINVNKRSYVTDFKFAISETHPN